MYDILKLFFEICLFKKGPQDLPYSSWLLRLLIILYVVVRFFVLAVDIDWLASLLQLTVEIILIIGFSWVLLYSSRKLHRFYQVTCALVGTDSLINFLALPGVLTLATGHGGGYIFLLMLGLTAWQCAIIAHIIHNAIDQKMAFSFGLSFLYLLASYQIITLLFPEIAGTT